tara:strand:+ start:4462 stop:6759 length:2298 start_codon:yes stop_codon:yes gene_type:complete
MPTTIIKRNGDREDVHFDKILTRIRAQSIGLSRVDPVRISKRVVQGVCDGVTTAALDELAADTAASLCSVHPEYSTLAARIAISRLHKETSGKMDDLHHMLDETCIHFICDNYDTIHSALVWDRDFDYDYFGFRTLTRSYLIRDASGEHIVERPQQMYMRIAIGIHCGDIKRVLETYENLSLRRFTHATPTMFNAGTKFPHLASCFLLPIGDDSIEGIMETNKRCALISKSAGGIGFSVSNVRSSGSRIHSTGGISSGLLPMLRCFEATARYVDQGGGKRKGAFAAYLEPWHPDIFTFLDMKKNHGIDELRARDLFYALWIPDLFMRRVQENGTWSLFCPYTCPDLVDMYGATFDAAYIEYENTPNVAARTVNAQDLWFAILDAQIESGNPYLLYKDACNEKSNQKNLGTIRSSNLCTEIVQYSSDTEIAVCNLASISLPSCIDENGAFSHTQLADTIRIMTRNLNRVIDRNAYARKEARYSNLRHRPIGLGVQGLADVFALLNLPFDGKMARKLNTEIFETIYFAALEMSCQLAIDDGSYASYNGSPMSMGILQMDMWDGGIDKCSERWDWKALRARIAQYGVRNSLLVAPMPTASTAQILGNNECFEPFTSNIYVRNVLAGEYTVVNKHLVRALDDLGLWDDDMRQNIIAGEGSVQGIPGIPDGIKTVFKTAWEISMRAVLDMSADRGVFVDQSQSLNLFVSEPNHKSLSSMHFYGWKLGLKTGVYYLRTRAAASAVKVTVDANRVATAVCSRTGPDCIACSA